MERSFQDYGLAVRYFPTRLAQHKTNHCHKASALGLQTPQLSDRRWGPQGGTQWAGPTSAQGLFLVLDGPFLLLLLMVTPAFLPTPPWTSSHPGVLSIRRTGEEGQRAGRLRPSEDISWSQPEVTGTQLRRANQSPRARHPLSRPHSSLAMTW